WFIFPADNQLSDTLKLQLAAAGIAPLPVSTVTQAIDYLIEHVLAQVMRPEIQERTAQIQTLVADHRRDTSGLRRFRAQLQELVSYQALHDALTAQVSEMETVFEAL